MLSLSTFYIEPNIMSHVRKSKKNALRIFTFRKCHMVIGNMIFELLHIAYFTLKCRHAHNYWKEFLKVVCLKRKVTHVTEKSGDEHIKFRIMKILVEQGISVSFGLNLKWPMVKW